MPDNPVDMLRTKLGYRRGDNDGWFKKALVRATSSVPGSESNQKMAWFGDSLLNWLVSKSLCPAASIQEKEPTRGELTESRKSRVNREALARAAIEVGIHDCLAPSLSRLEARNCPKTMETAFEAMVAAVYLDLGEEEAIHFVAHTLPVSSP